MQLKIYLMLLLTSIIAVGVAAQSWEFKAQAGIYASPVISMNSVYFGDTAGHLYAIDKYSGEEIWNVKLKGAIKSKPAIYGDLVIVYDASGQLSAYNKRHGSLQWKYQMSQEVQVDLWDYYLSSPVLEDSCVYIGSGDGHVYAFKAQTGQLLWRFKTGRSSACIAAYSSG